MIMLLLIMGVDLLIGMSGVAFPASVILLRKFLLTEGRMYVCSSGIALVEQPVRRTSEYIQDRQVARHPLWILLAMAEPPIYPKLCNTSSFA